MGGVFPDGRPLSGGGRARRARPGAAGGDGVRPRQPARHRARLPAQAGTGRVQAGRDAVAGAAAAADRPARSDDPGAAAPLLPRRPQPAGARGGPGGRLRRPGQLDPAGPPRPGVGGPEQRHAEDRLVGGHRRGADRHRGHLRHELRAHAGAAPGSTATPPRCSSWPSPPSPCTACSAAPAGCKPMPSQDQAPSGGPPEGGRIRGASRRPAGRSRRPRSWAGRRSRCPAALRTTSRCPGSSSPGCRPRW